MKAATAETTTGTCAKCKTEQILQHELNKNGQICDPCYLEIHQIGLPLDEHSLKPNEVTKEIFAEMAGWTSVRNVEKLKKGGKIPFTEARRRVGNVVRPVTIFQLDDVNNFLNKGKPLRPGTIDKEPEPQTAMQQQNNMPEINSQLLEFVGQTLQDLYRKLDERPKTSGLTELTRKLFLSVGELATVSGISKSRLDEAIKGAVARGTLQHYTGERGKSVYKCEELDILIANLPPTPKQLAPPPKKKADVGS